MGTRSTRARCALVMMLLACACDGGSSDKNTAQRPKNNGGTSRDAATRDDAGAAKDAGMFTPTLGDDPIMVTTAGGQLEGDVLGGAVRFLKIRCAQSPVGSLRWKAPQAAEPWDGVRHE